MTIKKFAEYLKNILYQENGADKVVQEILSIRYDDGRELSYKDIESILNIIRYGSANDSELVCLNESDNSALLSLIASVEAKLKEQRSNAK